ncbi:MAG: RnfABCDGE type electron transport complex subunit D [Clostridia bacterium]|nr:RnfABCDGE type electron transport complex subunit D [Clostridia bacterium]
MENNLIYSSSPHIKTKRTTRRIMIDVCIALIPATVMGVIYFGLYALALVALAVAFAVAGEYIYLLIMKKPFREITREFDFSSVVSGMLIGITIGTNYPWYSPVFGSLFAVIVVKMLFGGTGKNVVNPAIAGRVFIFISFQWAVGAWLLPNIGSVYGETVASSATAVVDVSKNTVPALSVIDMLLGTGMWGCIGETCKLALLAGGIYLAARKVINIIFPLIYIAVAGLTTTVIGGFDFALFLPAILSGGLILGAIFMATDYTTTPNTLCGNVIYFIALGILTAVLRYATNMETVSFAILLMNLTVPLIDKFILNKPFGYKKPQKQKETVR